MPEPWQEDPWDDPLEPDPPHPWDEPGDDGEGS
jgi:hypothetical protein